MREHNPYFVRQAGKGICEPDRAMGQEHATEFNAQSCLLHMTAYHTDEDGWSHPARPARIARVGLDVVRCRRSHGRLGPTTRWVLEATGNIIAIMRLLTPMWGACSLRTHCRFG